MSFIQVPIGKGIGKFPKLRFSQPEERRPEQIPHSDLSFLQNLTEDLRLVIQTGSISTANDIITITPDTGTTFYFLGGVIQNTDTLEGEFQIVNDGIIREIVLLQADEIYEIKLPIDRLVGNMSNTFTITGNTADISARASLFGWNENTVKIS